MNRYTDRQTNTSGSVVTIEFSSTNNIYFITLQYGSVAIIKSSDLYSAIQNIYIYDLNPEWLLYFEPDIITS